MKDYSVPYTEEYLKQFLCILGPVWNEYYVFGYPRVMPNYLSVVKALSPFIWMTLGLTVLVFTFLFLVVYHVYSKALKRSDLVIPGTLKTDIVLKVVCTLTEPQGVNIFQETVWSTGKKEMKSCIN